MDLARNKLPLAGLPDDQTCICGVRMAAEAQSGIDSLRDF